MKWIHFDKLSKIIESKRVTFSIVYLLLSVFFLFFRSFLLISVCVCVLFYCILFRLLLLFLAHAKHFSWFAKFHSQQFLFCETTHGFPIWKDKKVLFAWLYDGADTVCYVCVSVCWCHVLIVRFQFILNYCWCCCCCFVVVVNQSIRNAYRINYAYAISLLLPSMLMLMIKIIAFRTKETENHTDQYS